MRTLLLTILPVVILSAFCYKSKPAKMPGLSCVLTCNGTTFKAGEVPKLEVRIKNYGNSDIYLIAALDHSDTKRRMPYCYYVIEKPKPDTIIFQRCGTADPLKVEDFKLVKPKEEFNPYKQIAGHGYSIDFASSQKETFRNPGIYKIQFRYSTNSDNIHKFKGNFGFWDKRNDSSLIKELFAKVPKVDLVSNTIEIKIEE